MITDERTGLCTYRGCILKKAILGGLLDTDYVDNNTSNYLYGGNPDSSRDPYGDRDEWDSGLGKLVTATKTISGFQYDNPKNRNDRQEITVTVGNVGVYRASGNDITESKKRDLEEFLGAKYPVLFAQNFVTTEGEINAKVVDNSSVLYQFAKEIWHRIMSFTWIPKASQMMRAASGTILICQRLNLPCSIRLPE